MLATRSIIVIGLTAGVIVSGASSAAAERRPLAGLFACLKQSDAGRRASCLEVEAQRLQAAEGSRDIVVMDRAQAAELRKSARGHANPAKQERTAFVPIDTTLTGAQLVGAKWLFKTQGNGDWIQAEVGELGRMPRTGDRFRVRRGTIGGFLANIGTGPAVRVRSVQ